MSSCQLCCNCLRCICPSPSVLSAPLPPPAADMAVDNSGGYWGRNFLNSSGGWGSAETPVWIWHGFPAGTWPALLEGSNLQCRSTSTQLWEVTSKPAAAACSEYKEKWWTLNPASTHACVYNCEQFQELQWGLKWNWHVNAAELGACICTGPS